MSLPTCSYCRLGLMDYRRAWSLQKSLALLRGREAVGDTLLLVEHPPVYTLGRRGKEIHLLVPKEKLAREGVDVVRVDRGGDITFHGPGQLVGYPILSLKERSGGASRYLRDLEEVLMRALKMLGVASGRWERLTGVWVGEEKIGAIGVKIGAQRVTEHGFALNVNTDLRYFHQMVPCGIRDRGVTSLERVLGRKLSLEEVVSPLVQAFGEVFQREMRETWPSWLCGVAAREAGGE